MISRASCTAPAERSDDGAFELATTTETSNRFGRPKAVSRSACHRSSKPGGNCNHAFAIRPAVISALVMMAIVIVPATTLRGASPTNEQTPQSATKVSNPAENTAYALVDAQPDEDALRSYLGQSDLVVVGDLVADSHKSLKFQFRVDDVIKGGPQPSPIFVGDDRGWPGPNTRYPDGEMVLFLWRSAVRGQTNLETFWRPRDAKFGSMPATPALIQSLKQLAAAENPNSGENQLKALMRQFVPDCTLQELKYSIGNQQYSTAALVHRWSSELLDRREMKWLAETGQPQSNNITFMHCPRLTGALWQNSNVQTARDAEDYVRLILGLCAGPRALERWAVKAEPLGDSWLVTPTYVGPPAEVRAVGSMELVFMNRATGKVRDIREWRPNFKPGQIATIMRPTGMAPDGLDPAPSELDDPTLDFYLSRCEMVVLGKMMNDVNGGSTSASSIDLRGNFKVAETIKGGAAPGSIIKVVVVRRGMSVLKKDEELILFLSNKGRLSRTGTDKSPAWVTEWETDDLDFGALSASSNLVDALKPVAAAHGAALETPNLYWGAGVDGLLLRLQNDDGSVWKPGLDYTINATLLNHGSDRFEVARAQAGGELEVDGIWYSQPNHTNVFDVVLDANVPNNIGIPIVVGDRWLRMTSGVSQPEKVGVPLNMLPGMHTIRFAIKARKESAAPGKQGAVVVRLVSNELKIEVREDTSLTDMRPGLRGAGTSDKRR